MEIGRSLSWCLKVGCLAVLKWSSTGSPTHTSSLFICECGVHFSVCIHMCLVTQSCPNLCNPMDCSLPGSSIHGIILARILEWIACSFSRGSSQSCDWTHVYSHLLLGRQILYHWATGQAYFSMYVGGKLSWKLCKENFFPKLILRLRNNNKYIVLTITIIGSAY